MPAADGRCFGAEVSNGLIGLDDPTPLPPGPLDLFFVPEQDRGHDRQTEDESDGDCAEVAHDASGSLLADQLDAVAVGVADEGDAVALGAAAGAVGGLFGLDAVGGEALEGGVEVVD